MLPALVLDRDREVMQSAEHLRTVAEVEPGKVEEVAIPNVEEEVRGALVVAVLEQLSVSGNSSRSW